MPKAKAIKKVIVKKPAAKKPAVKKTEKPEKIAPVLDLADEKVEEVEVKESTRFFEGIGRRKTAIARVRIFTKGDKQILVNEKPYTSYFTSIELQQVATGSLQKMNCMDRFFINIKTQGGGINAQAEAVRHGIARALVLFNPDFRKRLRRVGYLTRDPRMRERKKFGLKRARRAPQWQKR